ncbi:MAG: ParB/RepB/Spo0J family partition protein [Spirochaetia bacterium]|nr:ParB/RepB/Spo0J family partition protein [Spirochaetia bacterium]
MSSKSKKLSVVAGIFDQNIEGVIRKIPIDQVMPSPDQPRQNKDINIKSLAASLQEEGLLQPIVVTKEDNSYYIVAGERRYRAAKSLNWKDIECRIIKKIPKDKYKVAVIENIQRENLSPIEESHAFKKLKNYFSYTDQQLSEIVGKSRNYISEILSIADLSEKWQHKADEAGIYSRNLLIQYAQAVKIGQGNEFLSNFQNGEISSVKTAKDFIKDKKYSLNDNNNPIIINKEPSREKINIPQKDVTISSAWIDENKVSIKIEISQLDNTNFTLDLLEKKINKSITTILSELSF